MSEQFIWKPIYINSYSSSTNNYVPSIVDTDEIRNTRPKKNQPNIVNTG